MKKLILAVGLFVTAAIQDAQARLTISWSYQTPASGTYYQPYNYNSCSGCHLCYDLCICHYSCSYVKPNYAANTEGYALLAGIFGGVAYLQAAIALLENNPEQFEAFKVATGLSGVAAVLAFISYLNVENKDGAIVKNNSKNLVVFGSLVGVAAAALYQLLG